MFKKYERIMSQIKFLLGIKFGYVVFSKGYTTVDGNTSTCTIYYKNAQQVKYKENLIQDSIDFMNSGSSEKIVKAEITNIVLMSEYNIKKMCGIS